MAGQMVERFHTDRDGFYDGEPCHLPSLARNLFDGAVPSATAAACELLARLAGAFERGDWSDIVQASIERMPLCSRQHRRRYRRCCSCTC